MSATPSNHAASAAEAPPRAQAFTLVFGMAMPILYAIGDLAALPLFTYHPGTDRIDWGWAPPVKDQGPAMYWYGWLAMASLGSTLLGGLAAWMAPRAIARLPLHLAWIVPVLLTPVMLHSLNYYWKW